MEAADSTEEQVKAVAEKVQIPMVQGMLNMYDAYMDNVKAHRRMPGQRSADSQGIPMAPRVRHHPGPTRPSIAHRKRPTV